MPDAMGSFEVNWNGDQVIDQYNSSIIKGMTKTMADCVVQAKRVVPVDTGTLRNSIKIIKFPSTDAQGTVSGTWGSADVNYALWVEIGTSNMDAQPYLRPSADKEYPKLDDHIKAFARGGNR